jgi:hypothetical protein
MRTFIKTITVVIMFATFTFAGPTRVDAEKINANIVKGLTHANAGVVESSIRLVILMKITYPEADYSDVIDQLEDLVMNGTNKDIRLKALIANDYLNNFKQYEWLKDTDYMNGDNVFDAYINQMSFKQVAQKN